MKAIILAGGFGTRLREVVADIPKPMAPVNGRPFLEMLIARLRCRGISDIILSVGYRKESIIDHFGRGESMGVSISYSPEDTPLGTGGAIRAAMDGFSDERYLVMNGDSLFDADPTELIRFHLNRQASISVALANVPDKGRYGAVETGPDDAVSRFAEKSEGGPGCINAGVYVVEKRVMADIHTHVFSFENDVLRCSIGKGLYGLRQDGFFIDIGVPADYRYCCELFSS